jgi:hypothetical protein
MPLSGGRGRREKVSRPGRGPKVRCILAALEFRYVPQVKDTGFGEAEPHKEPALNYLLKLVEYGD